MKGLTSDEHFTVDGTLLEAWASQKSFQPKQEKPAPPPDDPGNPTVNFRGERRSNETHESKTDPDALLARKSQGKESKLSYSGNLLVENRNGLIVDGEVFVANGTAERDAALIMLEKIPGTQQVIVGGDKGFDTHGFVAECRNLRVVPCRGVVQLGEGAVPVAAPGDEHLTVLQQRRRACPQHRGEQND